MSRFTEALLVSPMADGKTWVVMRPFGYEVEPEGSGNSIEVPVGFQTDFASIPRIFWILLPRWGTHGNASVIHDWLYWSQELSRPNADRIFLEAMGVLDVSVPVKYAIYWAVRALGRLAWYRNQADRAVGFDRVIQGAPQKAFVRSKRPCTTAQFVRWAWTMLMHKVRARAT